MEGATGRFGYNANHILFVTQQSSHIMLSTRLAPQLESQLTQFAAATGLSKSAVTEAALAEYMTRIQRVAKRNMDASALMTSQSGLATRPSARLLESLAQLSISLPNQDFNWKSARDEGRR